jgi:hypothetical protein
MTFLMTGGCRSFFINRSVARNACSRFPSGTLDKSKAACRLIKVRMFAATPAAIGAAQEVPDLVFYGLLGWRACGHSPETAVPSMERL